MGFVGAMLWDMKVYVSLIWLGLAVVGTLALLFTPPAYRGYVLSFLIGAACAAIIRG